MSPLQPQQSDRPWRDWWVFYIDPTEPQGSGWKTAGMIGGSNTADEAIEKTVGRRFPDHPFWAFALDKSDFGAYYELHYPESVERRVTHERRLGPAGYVAEPDAKSRLGERP